MVDKVGDCAINLASFGFILPLCAFCAFIHISKLSVPPKFPWDRYSSCGMFFTIATGSRRSVPMIDHHWRKQFQISWHMYIYIYLFIYFYIDIYIHIFATFPSHCGAPSGAFAAPNSSHMYIFKNRLNRCFIFFDVDNHMGKHDVAKNWFFGQRSPRHHVQVPFFLISANVKLVPINHDNVFHLHIESMCNLQCVREVKGREPWVWPP